MNILRAFKLAAAALLVIDILAIIAESMGHAATFWGFTNDLYLHSLRVPLHLLVLASAGYILLLKKEGPNEEKQPLAIPKPRKKRSELKPDSRKVSMKPTYLNGLPILLLCAASGALFWFVHIYWALLGDGTLYLGYIYSYSHGGPMTIEWKEALPMYLFQSLYGLQTDDPSSYFPFRIIGLFSGVAFVLVASLFSRRLFEERIMRLAALVLLCSTGGMIFFFGYVETYALSFAAVLLYLYTGYRFLEEGTPLWQPLVALVVAVVCHGANLMLVPSAVVLFLSPRSSDERSLSTWLAKAYRSLLPLGVILLTAFILYQLFSGVALDSAENPFIPFRAIAALRYTLLCPQHLLDIGNEHFLLAGVACALALPLVALRWRLFVQHTYLAFLVYVIFFQEAFLVGGYPVFGLARDWDAFAQLGISIVVLVLALLHFDPEAASHGRTIRKAIAGMAVLAFGQTILWVALNVNTSSAVARCEALLQVYRPLLVARNTQYGYENLRKLFMDNHDYHRELFAVRTMTEILPWPIALNNALEIAGQLGKNATAEDWKNYRSILTTLQDLPDSTLLVEEIGERHLRVNPPHTARPSSMADMYETMTQLAVSEMGMDQAEAHTVARKFITLHPLLVHGYELEGSLELADFRVPEALENLNKAVDLDSSRIFAQIRYAVALSWNNEFSKARNHFRSGITLDSNWISALDDYAQFVISSPEQDAGDRPFLEGKLTSIIRNPTPAVESGSSEEEVRSQAEVILKTLRSDKR